MIVQAVMLTSCNNDAEPKKEDNDKPVQVVESARAFPGAEGFGKEQQEARRKSNFRY